MKFDIWSLNVSVIWTKVWFDLWHNKVRTGLAVLSIAVGVFAIGVVFSLADQLVSGMDQAHRAVYPSHANMSLTAFIDRDTALSLKNIPGVAGVEPHNRITVRYKIRPEDEWKDGILIMRDDYEDQKYDVVQLKAGRWPGKDDVGIERQSSLYFGLDLGDRVIFKIGNTERSLPITSKIRHPFVQPPLFGGPAAFFVNERGLERFGIPDGKYSSLMLRVEPYSADYTRQVAVTVKDRLARQGVGVAMTIYQDPNKHWARFMLDGILVVLQALAVVSLFMSAVLVLNTLTALITQQTNQIGILKAIGGKTNTIVRVYLAGVLVYGVLALAISLPLGAFTAFYVNRWFLSLLNIDYDTLVVSNSTLVLQALAAVAVPLLAALWPTLSGTALTVQQAIATYGLGSDFGSSWLDRVVERVGQRLLPSHYAIALGNMFRRKARLLLTQLVLIVAGIMFLIIMSLSASVTLTMNRDLARRAYDTTIQFVDYQRMDRVVEMAQSVEGVERAEVWFIQPATIVKGERLVKETGKQAGQGVQLAGLPVGSGTYTPLIVTGRWLQPGDERAIVMNQETADDNQIGIGDTVTLDLGPLGKDDWQVVGLYRVIFGDVVNIEAIYAPQEAVFEAVKKYNQGSQLYVRTRLHTASYAAEVTSRLKDLYEGRKMEVLSSQTVYESQEDAGNQFAIVTGMLLALAVVVAMVGGIGLMGALSIGVVERTKEIGVMRAIGARSSAILGMFVMEGVLQGLFSWAVAALLSFFLAPLLSNNLGQVMFQLNLDYQYDLAAVGVWLAVILTISALASILPARSATLISVRNSLAYA